MIKKLSIALGLSLAVAGLTTIAARAGHQTTTPATVVLTNGKVVTVDANPAEAEAVAIRGDRIVAVGTSAEMKRYVGQGTEVIDLKGQLAIPGFIESHGHFTGVGEAQLNLNLMKATSWDQIVAMVEQAAKAAKPGQWIYGRGWHQEKWTSRPEPNVEGFPTHDSLSRVSPNNPVLLTHASGHASFANAKAMELSGVTGSTKSPDGGDFLKDAKGNPTGLFRETASRLIRRGAGEPPRTPDESLQRARKILELASQESVSKGITSFQDAGSSFADVDLMKRMVDEGRMNVRLWVMIRTQGNQALIANLATYRTIDYGNGFLTVRGIKKSIDGALGSRGAWLLEPYSDKPDSTGLATTPPDVIRQRAQIALDTGYQMCIHAIGDRANREVLNAYEETFKKNNRNGKDLRWRIEHAQHLNAADIPRFGQLGVIAAMQGVHCTSDAPWVEPRLGAKRAEEGAYVWQKLMKSGAVVGNGTDTPVEDIDPIASYYASVTRKTKDGKLFYGDQRMSRMEALRSYTLNNAFAAFEEDIKGSLSIGKLADITVLTKDITTVPDDEILQAKVAYTIVGGKIAYKAN
jgi:predicted amidohydrolase YtcJ